jgi:hypothetical protein
MLLTSLHLLGVDGQQLTTTQRGCKYEADMLVLDQRGVAVAIIEGEFQDKLPWACSPVLLLCCYCVVRVSGVDSMFAPCSTRGA